MSATRESEWDVSTAACKAAGAWLHAVKLHDRVKYLVRSHPVEVCVVMFDCEASSVTVSHLASLSEFGLTFDPWSLCASRRAFRLQLRFLG